MKLTFVTVSSSAIKYLIEVYKEITLIYGDIFKLEIYYSKSLMSDEKSAHMIKSIGESDLVFVDLMGSPVSVINSVYRGLDKCSGNVIPFGNYAREYLKLGKFNMESMKSNNSKPMDMKAMMKMKNMAEKMGKVVPGKIRDMRNYSLLMKYFKVADNDNIKNMIYLILREYGNIKYVPKPCDPTDPESICICDPKTKKIFKSIEEFQNSFSFNDSKPIIVILFYGHVYPTDTSFCISKIKERIEEFANVLPIAISGSYGDNKEKLFKFILKTTEKPIDLILNFMSFRLTAGPMGGDFQAGVDILKEANVPYIHPFFMTRRTIKEWEDSAQGCTASEVMISVMLPELDGCIETYPIGAMTEPFHNEDFDILTEELTLIDERVDMLLSRIKRHITLRQKPNKDKKVAILCYNYPPGESNLFGGAFLDTFASVEKILFSLHMDGYNVSTLNKEELMNIFKAGGVVNSGKYSDEWPNIIKYSENNYANELKNSNDYKEMIKEWGNIPGNIMTTEEHEFIIPGTILNNIFIGLQPSRGIHEDIDKLYHDKTLPPHHQYQAFYKWIREEFKADVIIHVGTHGTVEFLKGKECGVSKDCYSNKLLGDIPHMYLYYCGNPSEAIIAKRRAYANIISYKPPVFVQGELYGEYSKLMSLIDNYHQAIAISPQSTKDILAEIELVSKNLKLPNELSELENELYRMKVSLIPKGLHVFGSGFSDDESKEYVKGVLRYSRNDITSLKILIGKAKGYDMETLINNNDYKVLKNIEECYDEIFEYYMENENIDKFSWINEVDKKEFIKTLDYGKSLFERVKETHEIEGLLSTLSGKYNPAKLAGDIYRNTDILPTGYNLYQFDPRLVPTQTAYVRGKKICDNTLEVYIKENKDYPLSTGVILWGLETSRTQGETFSQILAYLGVKISDEGNVWDPKYEIIPIEELGRPRIDVTINICGFFRDMFSNLIDNLEDVFNLLYEIEESDEENYFKANSKKLYEKLVKDGYDEKEAKNLAISRIFGPKEGEYGTGITSIIETKNWENESQIGNMFLDNLKYVYNRNLRGKDIDGLYKENLKCVEIVSQIRSNHEYEITDLDHYYEFFGGLSKSVEIVKGKKVKMYITDTTDDRIATESIEKSIARGIRTRILNPKWIDGMLNHQYHGVQKIYDRFENLMGLAATTNSVDPWIYDDLCKAYVENDDLYNRLKENNTYAYINILEQMTEYINRGYWKASEAQIKKIKERYFDIDSKIEEFL